MAWNEIFFPFVNSRSTERVAGLVSFLYMYIYVYICIYIYIYISSLFLAHVSKLPFVICYTFPSEYISVDWLTISHAYRNDFLSFFEIIVYSQTNIDIIAVESDCVCGFAYVTRYDWLKLCCLIIMFNNPFHFNPNE